MLLVFHDRNFYCRSHGSYYITFIFLTQCKRNEIKGSAFSLHTEVKCFFFSEAGQFTNEAFRLLVAALHRGDVPQAQHPGLQSGEDDAVRHFLLGRHGIGHVDRGIGVVGMECAARGIENKLAFL